MGLPRTYSPEKLSSFSSFLPCFFTFLCVLGGFSIHLTSEVGLWLEGGLHVGGFYAAALGVFIVSVCIPLAKTESHDSSLQGKV